MEQLYQKLATGQTEALSIFATSIGDAAGYLLDHIFPILTPIHPPILSLRLFLTVRKRRRLRT